MTSGFSGRRLIATQTVGPVRNLMVPQREFLALLAGPDAVTVRTENGVVGGIILGPELSTLYAFQTPTQMTDHFATLFRQMLDEARSRARLERVILRLEDNPTRPWAEPLFSEVGFTHLEEWVKMALPEPEDWKPQVGLPADVSIREANEADVATIAEIDAACFGDRAWGQDGQRALLQTLAWSAIAEAGGKPIGYVQVRRTPENVAEIFELAVLPAERGRRYGSALLERALDWCARADVRRVEVTVPTDQPESLDLMRRYGFAAQRSGNTYRRPADDRLVEAARDEATKRSFIIQFGDWR